eukprot:NODE_4208_length_328_cov_24.340502_g4126_i0.p3 GENE.NODE_4208_length_328_cov_24.340502_g4126_i0~~NODE_4208_length_328_cov_24.340502_g4126_i0.p3  ORF type:complete len:85 (+),score=0.02 NODE_4208_length_328_cov_24.340502_g4126_i0:68-322(+)
MLYLPAVYLGFSIHMYLSVREWVCCVRVYTCHIWVLWMCLYYTYIYIHLHVQAYIHTYICFYTSPQHTHQCFFVGYSFISVFLL